MFEEDASYIKESAPKEEHAVAGEASTTENRQKRKTAVRVDVDVLSILEISEVDGHLSLQLNLKLTW